MKKILTMIAAISMMLVTFTNVKAFEIVNCAVNNKCYVYKAGDVVNFYKNGEEADSGDVNAGITSVVLSDNGSNDQYVRVLAAMPFGTSDVYFDANAETEPTSLVKKDHISYIEKSLNYTLDSARHDADSNLELEYIGLDELISVFGATEKADKTYSIDATKWGKVFEENFAVGSHMSKGFYTGTYDKTKGTVWTVVYTWSSAELTDPNRKITDITVKEVSMNNNEYAYVPVVYFDKTYECINRQVEEKEEMACYSCEDDYKWLAVGSQAETCKLVENVLSQSTCVKSVQTGVEDYILEFVGLASICGVALVIAKKKDLFRSI